MSVTDDLLALEDEMWQANREGNGSFYADLLRDDALVVSKYGVMTKAQGIPVIEANHNPYLKTELSGQQVIQLDESNALITYRVDVTALVNGNELELPSYATSVYTRVDGQWRGVFHQQTAL
ncbi:nuclear transport factor 2 family protein [Streptomyces sp. SID13031]|uniref:nuclear transport factor 2 family protein n=1 Tax=Streptomyces sp. SID13031 TaxID=2706046 RepID=UPI0013C895DF|nr:nuclear transport factor 2 family protein [Streptomyces sp. SID13031]NEA37117.1 nuclear transport factor 2 family protein [Streptomyces sp. SID13031]